MDIKLSDLIVGNQRISVSPSVSESRKSAISKTYNNLMDGRKLVGHTPGPLRRNILKSISINFKSKTIYFKSEALGTDKYLLTAAFYGVEFFNTDVGGLKFKRSNNAMVYCNKPSLNLNKVQVRCTCPDFYYTYWYYNHKNKAYIGNMMRPYVRKTRSYPERNPHKTPGLCKHLVVLISELKIKNIVVD